MGVVYKSRHAILKTSHAIKIILPDLVGNDPQLVTRFRQEALAAAAIRHQNVVGVSDYGVSQGTMPFLVMEFVEGESLHDLLDREQKLTPQKGLGINVGDCRRSRRGAPAGNRSPRFKAAQRDDLQGQIEYVGSGQDFRFRFGENKIGRASGFVYSGADDRVNGFAVLYGARNNGGRRDGCEIRYLFFGRYALSMLAGDVLLRVFDTGDYEKASER
jgi:hypothetical protein